VATGHSGIAPSGRVLVRPLPPSLGEAPWAVQVGRVLIFQSSSLVFRELCAAERSDPLSPLLFPLVLHPLALRIEAEFPNLDLCVWYLDDGTIIGSAEDVHKLIQRVVLRLAYI